MATHRRKRGLLHSLRAVEVEDVTVRMRRSCVVCNAVIQVRRLVVREGSGRSQKMSAYCVPCGDQWLRLRTDEYSRTRVFLRDGPVSMVANGIRL